MHLGIRVISDPQGYVDPLTLLPPRAAPAPPPPPPSPAPPPRSRLHRHHRCTLRRHRRPRSTHNLGSLQPPNLNRPRGPAGPVAEVPQPPVVPVPHPRSPLRRCRQAAARSRDAGPRDGGGPTDRPTFAWVSRRALGESRTSHQQRQSRGAGGGEPPYTARGSRRRSKPSSVRASARTSKVGRCPHCA